ncbi:MAG: tetratricopeptide repeat protein [bacterium]
MNMKRSTIYILLLLCLTLDVYANVYGGELLYDDYYTVRDNQGIRTLSNPETFFTDISRTSTQELQFDIYRPLTTMSFALTYALFGLNPVPYHATNIFLHAMNAILVFFLLRRAMGSETKAALAAAIFATHPAQVEAVSWISARGNAQSLMFMLFAMLAYLKWSDRKRSWSLYAASLILYISSMLSKESGIVLPALIFAWCIFVPSEENKTRLRRSVLTLSPFVAAGIVFLLVRTHIMGQVGQLSLHGGGLFTHTLFAIRTMASYLPMAFAPIHLTIVHYIPPYHTLLAPLTGVALSAIILAIYFPLRLRKRSFLYPLGMAWFFIALSPAANIVPIRTFTDERMLYVPIIGFAIFMVQGAYDVGALIPWRRAAIAFLLLLIVLYSVRTVVRNRDWAGPIQLWESVARVDPANSRAMYSLGYEYDERGLEDAAIKYYLKTIPKPSANGLSAMINLANIMEERAEIDRAMIINEETMKLYPHRPHGYILQARLLMNYKGDYARAEELLNIALKLDPEFYYVHASLAELYDKTSRPEEAKKEREQASGLNPAFGISGER